jgi:hypothetical protein
MRSFPILVRALVLACLSLPGCQKNEQSAVQPEKISEQTSASSAAPEASAPLDASAQPDKGAGGPLVPWASGKPRPVASASAAAPSASAASSAPIAAPTVTTEITLLDAGRDPKRELRLTAKVGQEDSFKMTMTMNVDMTVDGKPAPKQNVPPMIMTMAIKVLETLDNGDIRYSFTLKDTDVAAPPGGDPKVTAAMKQALAQLHGLKGTARVDSRGFARETRLLPPKGADMATKQILQGLEQAMQQISSPFPAEAVGVGARWKHVTTLVQNGVKLTQTSTYDVTKLEGDEVGLKVKVEQGAAKQKVESRELGLTLDLSSMKTKGKGTSVVRLTKIAPVKSNLSLSTQVQMAVQGQRTKVKTQMTIDVASL